MAQVGRISGPLLEANLERNGIDLAFRNDLDTVQLLYLDVSSGSIAVNKSTAAATLDVSDTSIGTVNLVADTAAIANYTFSSNNIDVSTGNILLNAVEAIVLSNLQTEEFFVSDNTVATFNPNTDIELRPTGTVEIANDLRVEGSLHATENISLDGTITFGDNVAQDTIVFEADINSSILPDQTDTFDLGSAAKRWNNLNTLQINGSLVTAGEAIVAGIDLNKRQEYAFYVATNGADTNVGDHVQGPLATIQEAISRIPTNNTEFYTIYVYPGTYAEQLPLVLPPNVTIAGSDIRNTVIVPAASNEYNDVFHMDGQTTVQNLTVKNFYYNSGNNTGYAFRYVLNGTITSRSPYVQNVSVITQGSTTGVDDPRGYVVGDAGRGAWIDGSELSSASVDASMLFHSVTMITPGADAVTMTNGVRVEWLNSFTYFANRGLYAVNGAAGRISQDGSTVNRGAEIRSIGSANVYGNFGAVADGSDTLMYLIGHNFAYVGVGKDVSNDNSLAVQSNETVEINSGKIYHSSMDHTGTFRVGDNFFVDFDQNIANIDANTVVINSSTGLRINTGADTTAITGSKLQTGAIQASGNLIESLTGDLNIVAATNKINLPDNVAMGADLDITGNFSFDGSLNLAGNEVTDSLRFNVEFEQDFNPNQHQQFSLGTPSKQWLAAHIDRMEAGDFSVYNNVIETNTSNADLELRASGTGLIRIPNSATFSHTLDVSGIATLDSVTALGTLDLTGNLVQTGNAIISDTVTVSGAITVAAAAQFEEILISNNVVTTTSSNTDLELRASGAGIVDIQQSVQLQQNISADDISAQSDVDVDLTASASMAIIGSIEVNNNVVQTLGLNQSLILASAQTITVPVNDTTFDQALTVQGATDLQTVVITGAINHTGNGVHTGNYDIAGELFVDQVRVEDNFITTLAGDTDIILSADGIGKISVPANDATVNNDLTVLGTTDLQTAVITGLLSHVGDRTQVGNFTLAGEFTNGDVVIEDNFITTTTSNSNLELRANGVGTVTVPTNNVHILNSLSVGTTTDVQLLLLTGTLAHIGNRIQTGNYNQTGNLVTVGSIDTNSTAQFTDISIKGNTVSTTLNNNNLVLTADGFGTVQIQTDLIVDNDLSVQSISVAGDVVVDQDLTLDKIFIPPSIIGIKQNYITTKVSNANLELRASGVGKVVFGNLIDVSTSVDLTFDNSSFTLDNANLTFDTESISQLSTLTFDNSSFTLDNAGLTFDTVFANDLAVNFAQDLIVYGNTNLAAMLLTGSFTHEGNRTQFGNYTQTGNLTISGNTTVPRSAQLDNIRIDQNNLTAVSGNLNLTASGTGSVTFSSLNVQQDVTSNTLIAGDIVIDDSLALELLESSTDIQIFDNVVTTTNSNSNLELRANGTGNIQLQEFKFNAGVVSTDTADIQFNAGDTVTVAATGAVKLPVGTTEQVVVEAIEILDGGSATLTGSVLDGGNALTIFTASSTIYNASSAVVSLTGATGSMRFNTDDSVFEGVGAAAITFGGVYSSDRQTTLLADPTNNTLLFTVNQTPVGTVTTSGLSMHAVQVGDIFINNNIISTATADSNLQLSASGSGELVLGNLSFKDNLIKNNSTPVIIANTGAGYSKLASTGAAVFPSGTVAQRPETAPETGDTRFNTEISVLEVWDGSTYISAAGTSATISEDEFNDLVLEFTLILG